MTDGACMTSTSTQNPSLTFMALTARAANHAIEEMKKGIFKGPLHNENRYVVTPYRVKISFEARDSQTIGVVAQRPPRIILLRYRDCMDRNCHQVLEDW